MIGRDPSTAVALLRVVRDEAPQLALTDTSVRPGAIALAVGALEGAPLAAHAAVALAAGPWRSLRGGEISRRQLNKGLAAAGLGLVTMPLMQRRAKAAENNIIYYTWEGYEIQELHTDYVAK